MTPSTATVGFRPIHLPEAPLSLLIGRRMNEADKHFMIRLRAEAFQRGWHVVDYTPSPDPTLEVWLYVVIDRDEQVLLKGANWHHEPEVSTQDAGCAILVDYQGCDGPPELPRLFSNTEALSDEAFTSSVKLFLFRRGWWIVCSEANWRDQVRFWVAEPIPDSGCS